MEGVEDSAPARRRGNTALTDEVPVTTGWLWVVEWRAQVDRRELEPEQALNLKRFPRRAHARVRLLYQYGARDVAGEGAHTERDEPRHAVATGGVLGPREEAIVDEQGQPGL